MSIGNDSPSPGPTLDSEEAEGRPGLRIYSSFIIVIKLFSFFLTIKYFVKSEDLSACCRQDHHQAVKAILLSLEIFK